MESNLEKSTWKITNLMNNEILIKTQKNIIFANVKNNNS